MSLSLYAEPIVYPRDAGERLTLLTIFLCQSDSIRFSAAASHPLSGINVYDRIPYRPAAYRRRIHFSKSSLSRSIVVHGLALLTNEYTAIEYRGFGRLYLPHCREQKAGVTQVRAEHDIPRASQHVSWNIMARIQGTQSSE